jgi:hypothetical protein
MRKRFVFVTLLIAMVVLTLMPFSLVHAEDTILNIVSGSNCDPENIRVCWTYNI